MRAAAGRAAAAAPFLWRRHWTAHQSVSQWRPTTAAAALPRADALADMHAAPPPPRMRLPSGEVHLWWMLTGEDDDAVACTAASMRAGGLVAPPDAHAAAAVTATAGAGAGDRTLLSRGLVRWVLTKYMGVAPAALAFEREARGKPRVVDSASTTPPLEFNVTHTRGLLGVAVACAGSPVGLDAELASRAPRRGALTLARRHFSPADVSALESLPPGPARDVEFVALWTLKEAYVKATGDGIARGGLASAPLRLCGERNGAATAAAAVDAALPGLPRSPTPRLVHWDGPGAGAWRFALLAPTERHVAAVCVAAPGGGAGSPLHDSSPPPLRVRAWRAAPLGVDGELGRGAVGLAASV